ncbi:MAG: DsbA family protein [Rhodospirillales bacterium]|nr:DsbA family protein [Rhodospirillales bacterium]
MDKTFQSDAALTLTCYTDPYCTWCWGSEPMLTKLRALYGERIKLAYKMGGLVRNIRQFYDAANGIGGNGWYKQVAAHWEEASQRHGMPVDSRVWDDVKDGFQSTYPACISFKAAELTSPNLANLFLRRLRESAAALRLPIHDYEVTAKLAADIGIDPLDFMKRIESGEAEHAFMLELEECRQAMIQSFPTFIFSNPQGQQYTLVSYRSFPAFDRVVRELAGEALGAPRQLSIDDDLMDIIEMNGSTTVPEIAEVFDIGTTEAKDALDRLVNKEGIEAFQAGNGFLYRIGRTASCKVGSAFFC